jgi:hypothetical protein
MGPNDLLIAIDINMQYDIINCTQYNCLKLFRRIRYVNI